METKLQQINSKQSKGRESTEGFEEMELEVKQKLQEKKDKIKENIHLSVMSLNVRNKTCLALHLQI